MLRLRTNIVRTEHRTFPNSQNVRVITTTQIQYKDSHRITIIVVTSTLYTLLLYVHTYIGTAEYVHLWYCTYICSSIE